MEFVFTIAVSGKGKNEERAFDDAIITLAEKVINCDEAHRSPKDTTPLIKIFGNELIESREVEGE
jgi:hypothetical protein